VQRKAQEALEMAGIIKAGQQPPGVDAQHVAFNFDDLTGKAQEYLDGVRVEAQQIVDDANKTAAQIRDQARRQGQREAVQTAEKNIRANLDRQWKTLIPALKTAIASVDQARNEWRTHWEQSAIQLTAAIARHVIQRELEAQPAITLTLLREALEMISSGSRIQVLLNADDYTTLGESAQALTAEFAQLGDAEIKPSADVQPGGCRVLTGGGEVDQQIETRLARIVEELTG